MRERENLEVENIILKMELKKMEDRMHTAVIWCKNVGSLWDGNDLQHFIRRG